MILTPLKYEDLEEGMRLRAINHFIFGYDNGNIVAIYKATDVPYNERQIIEVCSNNEGTGLGSLYNRDYNGYLNFAGNPYTFESFDIDKNIVNKTFNLITEQERLRLPISTEADCIGKQYPFAMIMYRGESFCSLSCFLETYAICTNCMSIVLKNTLTPGPGGPNICPSCRESCFTCSSCMELLWRDDYYGNGECYSCNRNEDDEDDDEPDDDDERVIHSYYFKPSPVFHKTNYDKIEHIKKPSPFLMFGIEDELECEENKYDIASDFLEKFDLTDRDDLYLKSDASLDNGFEIVSHPRTLKSWQEFDLESMFEWLKKQGCISHCTTTCGLHVHFSSNAISRSNKLKMGMFFWNNFEYIQKFSRRKYNTYCCPKPNVNKKMLLSTSEDRYEAINWQDRHAPEIRIFRGSLVADTVLASIELTHALITYSSLHNSVTIAKKNVDWDTFTSWILKQEYKALPAYLQKRNLISISKLELTSDTLGEV